MKTNKVGFRIIDICLQLICIFIYVKVSISEMRSWGPSSGDGIGMFFLIHFAWFLCVNVIFFFIQLLISSVKRKRYIFLFHNLFLYGFNFFWAIRWDKISLWTFYILLIIIVNYLVYDYLLAEITKSREKSILGKLVNPKK